MTAGYSKTPLRMKLGLKSSILNAPPHYADPLGPLPEPVEPETTLTPDLDFLQVFAHDDATLERHLAAAKPCLTQTGMLWLCWPKKASPLPSDIDDDWSGLKFVYRLEGR